MPTAGGWLAGLAVMVAAVALTTWLVRRLWPATKTIVDDELAELDRVDLDRAAGEGMGTAPGSTERRSSIPTTGEGLLAPLDSRRQTTEPDRLTGVMAEPTASARICTVPWGRTCPAPGPRPATASARRPTGTPADRWASSASRRTT